MLSKKPSNLNLLFIYTATKKKIKPQTYIGSVFVFLIPLSPGWVRLRGRIWLKYLCIYAFSITLFFIYIAFLNSFYLNSLPRKMHYSFLYISGSDYDIQSLVVWKAHRFDQKNSCVTRTMLYPQCHVHHKSQC